MIPRIAIALSLLALSCATAERYRPAGQPEKRAFLVFTEPNPYFTDDEAWQACKAWEPKGILCGGAGGMPRLADVIVIADEQRCGTLMSGGAPVHAQTISGHTLVYVDCFLVGSALDRPLLRRILAHEIGHALGLKHVPPSCDGLAPGTPCGPALMNPEPAVDYLTPADAAEFDAAMRRQER